MVFSSLSFLYYFLPIILIAYYVAPKKFRNAVLCVGSLLFYSVGEPRYIFVLLLSIVIDYSLSLVIEKYRHQSYAKVALLTSVIMNLSLLGFFKYVNFVLSALSGILDLSLPEVSVSLPIGISFFTFQTMSYTIDIYRGKGKARRNIIDMAMYVTSFPQLIAGPIVRYESVAHEIDVRDYVANVFSEGIKRFIEGLAKKVLLANAFGELYSILEQQGFDSFSVMSLWLMAIAFTLQIYFDFSGYSDMAIGLGLMFGFHFPENFNYPYMATSITDFWRRWHMSLGTWFRDYVYIPLGGNRVNKGRALFNVLFVWFLTGLWHGANWNYILWGLYFGIILVIEKHIKHLGKGNKEMFIMPFMRHFYVLFVIVIGFVIFKIESLNVLSAYLKGMFGFGQLPLFTNQGLYYLDSYGLLLLVGIVLSTNLLKNIKLYDNFIGRLFNSFLSNFLVQIIALFLITAFLVDASYNPFLYFRF